MNGVVGARSFRFGVPTAAAWWLATAAALGAIGCSNGLASAPPDLEEPGQNNPPPGTGSTGGGTTNPGGSTNPGGTTNPGGGSTNPGGGTTNPGGGSTDPGGGTTNPGGGSTDPGGTTNPDPGTGNPDPDPFIPDPGAPLSDCSTPGPRLVRRLTAAQYRNTLVDLFDDQNVPADTILTDPAVNGFHIDADAPVIRDLDAELLMNYAESVAAWAVENKKYQISPCTSHDTACRRQFIESFGRKVHREPLPEDRIAAYEQLMAAEETFEEGLHVAVSAFLQSPYLLYRRELGTADPSNPGQFKLTPYEIASQLSYFLTESMPDQGLLDAAAQGRLETIEDIDREAERLLKTDRAKTALTHFLEGWLETDGLMGKAKDPNVFNLTDSLRNAMLGETREFFLDHLFNNGTVSDLFMSRHTFVNQELASFYGLPGGNASGFARVDLTGTMRPPGLLGQGSFLTMHALPDNSSPVQRAFVVRERLLCQDLPPVPENLDTNLKPPVGVKTNRERYAQHSEDPTCSACHQNLDPVGFAFENFDAFGRYRDNENGEPIDATGMLTNVPEGEVPLDGVESLATYLASSDAVRSCLVRYWTYFAYGRDQWAQKECNHDSVRREASNNGYTLKSVLMGVLHAPHFTRRVQDQ